MIPIDERYQFGEELFSSPTGSLFLGTDVSLKRQVFLYLMDKKTTTTDEEYMRMMAGVSHFAHPHFFHILDMGSSEGAFAVMEKREGVPLSQFMQQENFNLSYKKSIELVIQVGKAVQDALEERIRGYSITADNLWIYRNQVMVINYWTEGERHHRGVLGLVHLLYQLLTKSPTIPDCYEKLEDVIRGNLNQLTPVEKGAILRIIRRAYNGQDSISSIILELSSLLQGPLIADNHIDRIPTEPQAPKKDLQQRLLKRPKTSILVFLLIIVLVAVWGKSYWKTEEASILEPPVTVEEPAEKVTPPVAVADGEPEKASPPAGDGVTLDVPNLIGLTKEDAEKLSLEHGLHYQFFLEVNERQQGEVFKQDIPAGSKVEKETQITFWVSKGPNP
ncbi:PASTA domain-containing protein [Ammoniphilus sp. CFH 90114]|uniref:PASTA domain-containing protein n=1 Tax=Ammoniphilus sp. CFH 90114 TaxID=2493665 RepID=UPI0013E956E2|nr:PASTA domain-containing protein [Ammoniphilus sp. CFH 90114]